MNAGLVALRKEAAVGIDVSSSYAENEAQILSMNTECSNMKRTITETTGAAASMGSKALTVASIFSKGLGLLALGGVAIAAFGLLQSNFGGSINSILQMATQNGPQIIMSLVNGILTALPNLMTQGTTLINNLLLALNANLPALLTGGMQILFALINGVASALPTLIPTVLTVLMTIIGQLIANLPMIITAGINLLIGLISGLVAAIPMLIAYLPVLIQTMVDTLIANLPIIIQGGIQLLMGIINGIISALPILISYLPMIIQTIVNTLVANLPMIIRMGIDLLMKLASGLISAIPSLVAQIPQIITSLVNAFKDIDLLEVGKDAVKGLWNGISDMVKWVLDKVKEFGKKILDGIKGVLGIHSPSIYTYKMGVYVDKGFIKGIEAMDREVNKAFGSIFSLSPSLYGSATRTDG